MVIHKYINFFIVLFAFVFPISLGGANVLLGIILLLWLVEGNFKQKLQIFKTHKILWIFLTIGILTLTSALLSHSMFHGFLAHEKKSLVRIIFAHYILIPLLPIIIVTSVKKEYLRYSISAFLLAILLSEIISYLIFFQIIDIHLLQIKHLIRSDASISNPTPFMHHTEYSVFLSIAAILLLDRLLHTKHHYLQFFILLFLTSATVNLFINGGRTGQISYLIAISTYMFFYFRFNLKIIFYTLTLLSTVVILAYHFSPTFHQRSTMALENIQDISHGDYSTSWGLRVASIKVSMHYLFSSPEHFLFGAGAGDCRETFLKHAKEHFGKNISEPIKILAHLHNQYLEYWMDGTLFSFILFLFYFYLLLHLPLPRRYRASLYAFATIVAFASATDIPLFRYQPATLFMLLTAYFILHSYPKIQEKHIYS